MYSTCGLGFYLFSLQCQIPQYVLACVRGENKVVLYLSLIHRVVTYVDDWSGVSLGGPYERDKEGDRHCTQPS